MTGDELEPAPWIAPWRRSATPCSSSATATRSRSTSTPTTRSRRRASSPARRRSRASTSPTCASRWWSAPAPRGDARRRACGVLAVVSGEGMARDVRLDRRAAARRRRDAQPLDLRAAGRHPRRARRGGGRLPTRRTCSWRPSAPPTLREDRPRRPSALPAGRPRRGGRARPGPPQATPPRCARRSSTSAPARSPRRRATTPTSASAAAKRSASSRRSSWPGASPQETLEAVLGALARDAELVTLIAGAAAAGRGRRRRARAGEVELEHSFGGQPSYWWLISAE